MNQSSRSSAAKLMLPPLDVARISAAGGRPANEDSIAIHPTLDHLRSKPVRQIFVFVADGMGGGEIGGGLSQQAVSFAIQSLTKQKATDEAVPIQQQLEKAYQLANQALKNFLDLGQLDQRYFTRGGSTMVGAIIEKTPDAVVAHIANIGDSRAYLLRDGRLRQLTQDHNYLNQLIAEGVAPDIAARDEQAERLTYRLGRDTDMREVPHFYADHVLQPNDTLLLCTDGLSRYLDDATITQALSEPSAQKAVDSLLKAAMQARTKDNVSAAVVRYAAPRVTAAFPWKWLIIAGAVLALAAGGVGYALNLASRSAATATVAPTFEPTVTNIAATSASSNQPLQTESAAATVTLAPVPTNTATPTNTPTPTPTSTPTSTPRPTPRPTLKPPSATRVPATAVPAPVVPPTITLAPVEPPPSEPPPSEPPTSTLPPAEPPTAPPPIEPPPAP